MSVPEDTWVAKFCKRLELGSESRSQSRRHSIHSSTIFKWGKSACVLPACPNRFAHWLAAAGVRRLAAFSENRKSRAGRLRWLHQPMIKPPRMPYPRDAHPVGAAGRSSTEKTRDILDKLRKISDVKVVWPPAKQILTQMRTTPDARRCIAQFALHLPATDLFM